MNNLESKTHWVQIGSSEDTAALRRVDTVSIPCTADVRNGMAVLILHPFGILAASCTEWAMPPEVKALFARRKTIHLVFAVEPRGSKLMIKGEIICDYRLVVLEPA